MRNRFFCWLRVAGLAAAWISASGALAAALEPADPWPDLVRDSLLHGLAQGQVGRHTAGERSPAARGWDNPSSLLARLFRR